MRRFLFLFLPMLALLATWATPAQTRAASGITDDGHFFSSNAIHEAENIIRQNAGHHHSDIRIISVPAVPDELKDDLASQGKSEFFEHWAGDLAKRDKVDGVLILICRDPSHLQTIQGNETREKVFPNADRLEMRDGLIAAFNAGQHDKGLLDAVRFIKTHEEANIAASAAPAQPYPNVPPPVWSGRLFSVGSLLCVGIAVLVIAFIVIGAVNRSRGYGGGYGAPPPGGYPPGYSGGYPQQGGYGGGYGGGGGGFGRGFLGGLLGGAVGAWGYDKLTGRDNSGPNYNPGSNPSTPTYGSQPDPSDQPDSSYSGSGGDFNSDPNSGGGDFGGGGSDSGSSSDSGGGDFGGGGGGDFGGGGDSGSAGGDF